MKRKKSTVPCRVYAYGLLPPEGRAVVDEQILLAHRYYNDLVEVEYARRQAYRWARDKVSPEELKEVSKRLNEERKDICNARVRDPEWGPGLRGTCGLYSGTYLMIEAQVDQAIKAAIEAVKKWKKNPKGPCPSGLPKFRRWGNEGSIGVQCAGGGVPVSEFIDGNHRLGSIDTSPRYHRKTKRLVKHGVRLTIPVAPGGVRVTFDMKMHRPLPADGTIKWIKIVKRRTAHGNVAGTRERWEAHITVEAPSFIRPERKGPVAAIDLCWSKGRVGHLLGEDGYEEPIRPHRAVIRSLRYADSIRSIRDGYLNVAKEWAAMNIDPRVRSWDKMKARGMIRKMRQWREEGHDVSMLDAWRHRDDHLWQIERNVREKAKRRLTNDYRVWARKIVERYPVLILENINLSEVAEKNRKGKKGNSTRFAYAPSHVRDALVNAGAKVIKVPPEYTSMNCPACSAKLGGDYHARECASCGWSGDRREGAARNIFARGLATLNRPVPLALRDTIGVSG